MFKRLNQLWNGQVVEMLGCWFGHYFCLMAEIIRCGVRICGIRGLMG